MFVMFTFMSFFLQDIIANGFEMQQAGFGFNLIFTFTVMVPFTYCLQARFLLEHPVKWNPFAMAGFFLLNSKCYFQYSVLFAWYQLTKCIKFVFFFLAVIGYIIFRGANSEKVRFRRDPHNPVYASKFVP